MFTKIVRQAVDEGQEWKTEDFYECDSVHIHDSENGTIFDMESRHNSVSVEISPVDMKRKALTNVYFLSQTGRTIDSYTFEGL